MFIVRGVELPPTPVPQLAEEGMADQREFSSVRASKKLLHRVLERSNIAGRHDRRRHLPITCLELEVLGDAEDSAEHQRAGHAAGEEIADVLNISIQPAHRILKRANQMWYDIVALEGAPLRLRVGRDLRQTFQRLGGGLVREYGDHISPQVVRHLAPS